jgi:hypothetical protein
MSYGNVVTAATDFVAAAIAQRYAHPGRFNYLYLFQLKPEADFTPLVPALDHILAAWIDEGEGLRPVSADLGVERCRLTYDIGLEHKRPKGSHERRMQMARSVLFAATQPDEDTVEVRLLSRALVFSPKGDREAHEVWHPGGAGWYSVHQPDE